MATELYYKIAFYVIFFGFAFVMTAYTQKARFRTKDISGRVKMHNENEVPLLLKLRTIFGVPFYLGLIVWTFAPKFMEWSALALPPWMRSAGLILGVLSIFLNGWSHKTLSWKLGEDFDPALRLLKVPVLVKEGPYAYMRHPIYLAFFLMQISVLFLTANWFIGLCGIAIITAVIALRVPREEKILIGQFGEQYRAYMKTSGALLPRIK